MLNVNKLIFLEDRRPLRVEDDVKLLLQSTQFSCGLACVVQFLCECV